MYQYEEKVMSSWDATMLYRKGLMSEEELERIRKINKQKYAHTEKGKVAVQRATENFKNKENYKMKLKEYRTRYYNNHRDEILLKKKNEKSRQIIE